MGRIFSQGKMGKDSEGVRFPPSPLRNPRFLRLFGQEMGDSYPVVP